MKVAEGEFATKSKEKSFVVIVIFILLVIVLIPLTIYTVNYINEIRTKALPTESPQEVEVTNVMDTSATISWQTPSQKTIGYVKYGDTTELTGVAFDKRDNGKVNGEYSLHYVELSDLTPSTTYYYAIVVGGKEYLNNESPYQFTAGQVLSTIRTPVPLKGDVEDPSLGSEEVIVFLYARNGEDISNKLSVLTSSKRYSFDLSNLRSLDLGNPFTDLDGTTLYFSANGAERGEGSVEVEVKQL